MNNAEQLVCISQAIDRMLDAACESDSDYENYFKDCSAILFDQTTGQLRLTYKNDDREEFFTINVTAGQPASALTPQPRIQVNASDIVKEVGYDPEPSASYDQRMADDEGAKAEIEAIERGDIVGYYCKAVVTIVISYGASAIEHRIASPGLWGIFAESDNIPYFDEVFAEERETLICMLTAIGIAVEDDSPQDDAGGVS